MSRRAVLLLAAAVTVIVGALIFTYRRDPGPDERYQKLQGKWLRPDGGYVLTIAAVDSSGNLIASYANPQPIRVHDAKAAVNERGEMMVTVELRDVNYPGSTYTLRYSAETDRLEGDYYQAAMRQHFPVVFVRRP